VQIARKEIVRSEIRHKRKQRRTLPSTTIVDRRTNDNSELAVDSGHSYSSLPGPSDVRHTRCREGLRTLVLTLAATLVACSTAPPPADNARVLTDIAAHRAGAEEVMEGKVLRVLPNSNGRSGVHERFIVDVRANDSQLPLYVTDNISVGQAPPLHVGDRVVVKGELAFNDRGPLLHYTHRDPRMRHAPGFVEVGGHVYE
jgi:uncharacterized protein DUF3465